MKKTLFSLLLLLNVALIFAQNQTWEWAIRPQFDNLGDFSEGLALAEQNGKCGFIDKKGKWVIRPQFQSATMFREGLASAQQNDKWGCIDKKGKWIIQPIFQFAFYFDEGLAVAISEKDELLIIDKKGQQAINLPVYGASHFSGNWAAVQLEKDGKYGFIDKKGEWLLKPQFDMANVLDDNTGFVVKEGKYGIIDKNGKWIFESDTEFFSNFSENMLPITNTDDKYGYVNQANEMVIPFEFDYAYSFSEGLALASKEGKYGFINNKGKWVIEPQFEIFSDDFENGLAKVAQDISTSEDSPDLKWGFIDKTGKWVVELEASFVAEFSEGLASVQDKKTEKWGFIRLKNKK